MAKDIRVKIVDIVRPVSGYLEKIPVDVKAIISELGYKILPSKSLLKGQSGVVDFEKHLIWYNKNDHPNRIRSTLAHEAAHILLVNAGIQRPQNYIEDAIQEKLVDEVGFELLLPRNKFSNDSTLYGLDIWSIAKMYKVSYQAAAIRLSRISTHPLQIAHFNEERICSWVAQTASFSRHVARYKKNEGLYRDHEQTINNSNYVGYKEKYAMIKYQYPPHSVIIRQGRFSIWVISFVSNHIGFIVQYWKRKCRG